MMCFVMSVSVAVSVAVSVVISVAGCCSKVLHRRCVLQYVAACVAVCCGKYDAAKRCSSGCIVC